MRIFYGISRCLTCVAVLVAVASAHAADDGKPDSAKEQSLIETLRTGRPSQKAIACKQLAMHGSKAAVPELEKLLADEKLASWARIALEVIPDAAADEALRNQVGKLQGNLLIGAINSIGVRRDQAAVEALATRLADRDAEVASAAAVALGRIGNEAATKALRQSLAKSAAGVRSAVAEGCILCAERMLADGKAKEAAELYDEVCLADVPKQRMLEAVRGVILARKTEGIPLLIEQLESTDKGRFQIALSTVRQLKGSEIDKALASQLTKTKPERAVLLLSVIADRGDASVIPVVSAAAKSGDPLVRMAAVGVIGQLGDVSSLPALLEIASGSNVELAQAAKNAIAAIHDEAIDSEIVSRIAKADGAALQVLVELVGLRRIDSNDALNKALNHSDETIRRAALRSWGETIRPQDLRLMMARTTDAKHAADLQATVDALKTACVRMPDRDAVAVQLAEAMPKLPVETQAKFVEILAAVGGPKALEAIAAAGKSNEELLPDTATRVLGAWLNTDAGPVLLDLAKNEPTGKFRVRALRGYIRLARQFATSDRQRTEMCGEALLVASRPEEQRLVLQILERYPSAETLLLAIKAAKYPAVKDEAARVALAIAQKSGVSAQDIQKLLTSLDTEPLKVEIVKAEYGAGNSLKDVTEVLREHTADSRFISLPSTNYNTCFEGDPAPNVVKQLKVQYRINGKAGEATFAENALVLLPAPK
jgi:HEAT repeat protein